MDNEKPEQNGKISAFSGMEKLQKFISSLEKIPENKPLSDSDIKNVKDLSEKLSLVLDSVIKKKSKKVSSRENSNNILKILELYKSAGRPKKDGVDSSDLSLFFKVGYTYEKQLDKNLDIAFSTVARDVKNCDRYQNTKNVKSIASTVKKAWLRHGALNHWKEIREFFDRKMTDDEFLEWKTNFRMKTKNSDRSTIKVKT